MTLGMIRIGMNESCDECESMAISGTAFSAAPLESNVTGSSGRGWFGQAVRV